MKKRQTQGHKIAQIEKTITVLYLKQIELENKLKQYVEQNESTTPTKREA